MLWCVTMLLIIKGNAQNISTSNFDQFEVTLEFSGQIENQLDSIFNIVVYLSDSELEEIEKVSIKRIQVNEDITLEKILPKKERKKLSLKTEKQKVILGTHSASNPFLGLELIDKKGKKINN